MSSFLAWESDRVKAYDNAKSIQNPEAQLKGLLKSQTQNVWQVRESNDISTWN